jgi:hypothetical protein
MFRGGEEIEKECVVGAIEFIFQGGGGIDKVKLLDSVGYSTTSIYRRVMASPSHTL